MLITLTWFTCCGGKLRKQYQTYRTILAARRRFPHVAISIVMSLVLPLLAISQQNAPQPLSVPAEFQRDLLPGYDSQAFLRLSDIHVDSASGEIFVAESGHNRIMIFDEKGILRFQFSCTEALSHPMNVVVDSEGFIYVLGPAGSGRIIYRYDYDGLPLGALPIPETIGGEALDLSSIDMDVRDRIFALDRAGSRILIFTREGALDGSFGVATELDADLRREMSFGELHIHEDRLYLPMSSMGLVQIYDLHGRRIRNLGRKGSTPGEMSFPIAVAHDTEGMLLVLDKHRFNVLGFDAAGRFLGEFGGRGFRSGWFYHPSLLAVDTKDQVYVGQLYENRIQVCGIPEFMTRKISTETSAAGELSPLAGF